MGHDIMDGVDDQLRRIVLDVVAGIRHQHVFRARNFRKPRIVKFQFQILFEWISGEIRILLGAGEQDDGNTGQ